MKDEDIIAIATNLSNLDNVKLGLKHNKDKYGQYGDLSQTFFPLSLSHGYPALVILYTNIGNTTHDEKWYELANQYIKKIVNTINDQGIMNSLGLFSGISGLALSINYAGQNGKNYSSLLNSIHDLLASGLLKKLEMLREKDSVEMFDYDVAEGISGICNYLLIADSSLLEETCINECLNYLAYLSEHTNHKGRLVPRWYIENKNLFSAEEQKKYTLGVLNTGLSHGIIGPLITLCNAYEKGYKSKKIFEAINRITRDLLFIFEKSPNAIGGMIGLEQYFSSENISKENPRSAWCYGSLGVAYGLLKSSDVLQDDHVKKVAIQYIKKNIGKNKQIYSPSFCHGYSGALYLYERFYEKTKINEFKDEVIRLKEIVSGYFEPEELFGFKDIEYISKTKIELNSIGMLQGISGIILVLLSFNRESDNTWNTFFMLND